MSGWSLTVLIVALALGVALTFWRARWLHGALAGVAALGIWMLVAPPQVERVSEHQVTLDTAGGAVGGYQWSNDGASGTGLFDLPGLLRREPHLARLRVRGPGLPASAWAEMPPVALEVLASRRVPGIRVAEPLQFLGAGEPLHLAGRVIDPQNRVRRIRLVGEGDLELVTTALDGGSFEIEYVPRVEGALVFDLQALDDRERLVFRERLAVYVQPAPALQVRMVLSRPSFEARALRHWLEGSGAILQSHVAVSRGIVRSEGIGTQVGAPQTPFESLGELDLLVLDAGTVAAAGRGDLESVETAVRAGLGVLVLADEELLDRRTLWGIGLTDRSGAGSAARIQSLDAVASRVPVGLQTGPAGSLIQASNGESLVAVSTLGEGAVAISLLTDTHTWPTSGDETTYAGFWAGILEPLLEPGAAVGWLQPALSVPVAGTRVEFCRSTAGCQSFYPEESGWFTPHPDVEPVFVFEPQEWRGLRADRAQQETRIAALRNAGDPVRNRVPLADPMTLLIWLLVVLGGLWLAHKLRPR